MKIRLDLDTNSGCLSHSGASFRLRKGRNILQDIRSGEVQYFTGPNQNLPDRKFKWNFDK